MPAGSLTLNTTQLAIGAEVAVADITGLVYLPAQDVNGVNADSFTFQVRDDGGTANGGVDLDPIPRTITFDIKSVNDIPVVDLDVDDSTIGGADFTASFTTGGAPVPISDAGDISISDIDHTILQSLTVTLTNRPDGTLESLAAVTGSLSGSYDPANGSFVASGCQPAM